MLETFHFLRPQWFIAIPFIVVLLLLRIKHSRKNSGWEDICDPVLLQYQLAQQADPKSASSFRLLNWTVPIIFFIGIISLAGPSWEKKEQPVFQQGNALVIILDLSLSMNATDIKPSRIERAKLKLTDILKTKKEGQNALIAFAGDAHTVSPLTIDSKTIISLLPALNSGIMPLSGSHLLDALNTAKQLFQNAGFAQGDVLLLSDGVDSSQQDSLKKHIKKLRQQGYRFSVIGIGSQAGSPIPMAGQGGFIKDQSGQVVLSKLAPAPLEKLARIGGGAYSKLSLDDSDFQAILKQKMDQNNNLIDQDKQLEQWLDNGVYFTLILIPLALLSFRKGIFSLLLCLSFASSFFTEPSYADEQNNKQSSKQFNKQFNKQWQQLWSTADQQGQKSFNAKDYQAAADTFSNQQWKASAYYRSGDYEKALEQYTQSDDTNSLYNKGNTLAQMNKFQDAIKAYEEVLKKGTELDAAMKKNTRQNLDYVKELLAQQKKQSSDKSSDKKKENSEQTSEDQDQQQQKSSDDSSKSNDSNSDESEQNKSEDSNSEGTDTEGEDSAAKGDDSSEPEDSSEPDNSPEPENSDSKSAAQAKENEPLSPDEPKSPDEAKTPDKAKPIQEQEKKPEGESQQASQAESSEDESQKNIDRSQNDVLSQLTQEEQQSMKQWLQRIPDNPGELLRIKFRNNTLLKQRQADSSDIQYEGNPW